MAKESMKAREVKRVKLANRYAHKREEIAAKLKEGGITRFLLLFRGSRSRSEVVATFLAVLELCKARVLHLAGSETDCIVRQERDDVPENLTF